MSQKIYFRSLKIEKLEAILRRLPRDHPARGQAESMLSISNAGVKGERSLDYPLSFLNEKEYTIYHGTRLFSGNYFFQMDILLLHTNMIVILEVKNLAGTLIFDTANAQLIQQLDGREIIYSDPIQQVEHQHFQLKRWLESHNLYNDIPISSYVVLTNDSAKIVPKNNEKLLTKKVLRNPTLRITVENLQKNHIKEFLTEKNLKTLKRLLIKGHTPHDPDLLNQLNINKNELRTGVHCPECFTIPMERLYGKWLCLQCKTTSKNAHLDTLRDYHLLIQPSITNQQLRSYLQIDSRKAASHLLKSLNLPNQGRTSNFTYDLSPLWPHKKRTYPKR